MLCLPAKVDAAPNIKKDKWLNELLINSSAGRSRLYLTHIKVILKTIAILTKTRVGVSKVGADLKRITDF